MFNGVISVRIKTENQILAVRTKARWLAEKIGFDKVRAGVLSTIISEIARLILSQTNTGRIDILSIRSNMKTGVTILAFVEELERNEIEKKLTEKRRIIKRIDFSTLAVKQIVDEFRIFPVDNRELIMQITKWV